MISYPALEDTVREKKHLIVWIHFICIWHREAVVLVEHDGFYIDCSSIASFKGTA